MPKRKRNSENKVDLPHKVEVEDVESSTSASSSDERETFKSSDDESDVSGDQPKSDNAFNPPAKPFCLIREVATRIKGALFSENPKEDPVRRIVVPFDKIVFANSLAAKGCIQHEVGISKKIYYTIPHLPDFNHIFGERWYIRGINAAGDFHFVIPGTVQFYLKQNKRKVDYQLQKDGQLLKKYFGTGFQLVFTFVRGDGNMLQWNDVLKQCEL